MVLHETYKKILCIIAFFCPPLAILIHCGCNTHLLYNVLLTVLFFIPGVIHAWWVIRCYEDPELPGDPRYVRYDNMCQALLCILAVFLPPLAVLLHSGCDCNLLINFLLTCLGFIPGMIHAWYLICCYEEPIHTHTTVYVGGQNSDPMY